MAQITVDTGKLKLLIKKGSEIVFTPKAEEQIIAFLDLQTLINATEKELKERIAEAALAYNPFFTSVQSDKIKVSYKAYGGKYYLGKDIDQTVIDQLIEEGIVKADAPEIKYTVDTKVIDKFAKEHGALPVGINAVERTKQLSLKKIEAKDV